MPFIGTEFINDFATILSKLGIIESLQELTHEDKKNIIGTSIGLLSMSILTFFILKD